MKEDGTTEWIFESLEDMSEINSADYKLFWIGLYGTPLIWSGLLILALFSFKFQVCVPGGRGVMDESREPRLRGPLDVVAPKITCSGGRLFGEDKHSAPRGVPRILDDRAKGLIGTYSNSSLAPRRCQPVTRLLRKVEPALLTAPPCFPAALCS